MSDAPALLVRDALGRALRFREPPGRIVSLVPSLTETLFALGAGDRLVGRTDFCVHPERDVKAVPALGGTKNPRLAEILELEPDLVLCNKEENRRRDVDRLLEAGVQVLVTYARSVEEAAREISTLGALTRRSGAAEGIVAEIARELERARETAAAPAARVVALIWRRPWMAVGGDTFASDLLRCAGGANACAELAGRYPRLEEEELLALAPEVLLLPTEPYAFGEADRRELLRLDCPAARAGRVHVVEGELLSWYGPRIPRALRTFSALLAPDPGA